MSGKTGIAWTETTWNPVVGCTKVSEGCRNCYAMRMAQRVASAADGRETYALTERQEAYRSVVKRDEGGLPLPQWNNTVICIESALSEPLRWREPRMCFVNSMSDLFHPEVPVEFIDRVFAVMALTPHITYQVLTKRPERAADYLLGIRDDDVSGADGTAGPCGMQRLGDAAGMMLDGDWIWNEGKRHRGAIERFIYAAYDAPYEMEDEDEGVYYPQGVPWPLPNLWLGTSIEDQPTADARMPHLLRCPAAVRFVSAEPLLGGLNFGEIYLGAEHYQPLKGLRQNVFSDPSLVRHPRVHWVIAGGESGPGARPCDVAWLRSLRDQCREVGVPFFCKQVGACVEMTFDEWNDLTDGGASGSERFTLLFDGCDRGYWKPNDRAGADPAEWPEDLRVREWPVTESTKGEA